MSEVPLYEWGQERRKRSNVSSLFVKRESVVCSTTTAMHNSLGTDDLGAYFKHYRDIMIPRLQKNAPPP